MTRNPPLPVHVLKAGDLSVILGNTQSEANKEQWPWETDQISPSEFQVLKAMKMEDPNNRFIAERTPASQTDKERSTCLVGEYEMQLERALKNWNGWVARSSTTVSRGTRSIN
jgi:hypothetical protein